MGTWLLLPVSTPDIDSAASPWTPPRPLPLPLPLPLTPPLPLPLLLPGISVRRRKTPVREPFVLVPLCLLPLMSVGCRYGRGVLQRGTCGTPLSLCLRKEGECAFSTVGLTAFRRRPAFVESCSVRTLIR